MTDLANKQHSLAHLLAAAVLEKFPDAKLGVGPAIENGFYYDFVLPTSLSPEDLPVLEARMKELAKANLGFERQEMNFAEAKSFFEQRHQPFKVELINDIEKFGSTKLHEQSEEVESSDGKVSLYQTGDFIDLCRGGHVENTTELNVDAFMLEKIAGAYWRGDEKNPMMTRIYGLAFETKADLEKHLAMLEEAKKRDHRKLGEELDLFHFDESIGKGLPIWLPKGNIIKEELENWAKDTETEWGYQRVTTPIITKQDLFYTSGHLPLYKDSMYSPLQIEDDNYYIKPMNCPFHHKTFAARPKSYRELPVRLAEYGWCHRYEDSGSLFGLMRVRGMQMNDAHIYVQKENAVEEFVKVIKLHEYYYKTLGITEYEMELALRDPNNMDKYHGDEQDWVDAEKMTIEAMELSGVPYKVVNEGAAFYGPKMDFQIYSSIGRSFTASTNQLDLFMGKRFELEYIDQDGQRKTPAVIHRAPLGTHERFIGFLIEHFAGNFPVWLSPIQAVVLPISDKHAAYAEQVVAELKAVIPKLRIEIDIRSESVGKRIREAASQKVPYLLVVGDKEAADNKVAVRGRGDQDLGVIPIAEFAQTLSDKIKNRSL
ncbi:TPA: threonine--tRNA ligase [Patescibacteria group bacterium]|nr:threonine--tRNA ligase [Patescibacteria group bacterium]